MTITENKYRSVKTLAWLIPAFAVLEPVWMLTPFVGFLYGSIMNKGILESSTNTSWLLYFVLPARGFILPGLVPLVGGMLLFGAGAFQVYRAKALGKGLVTTGVYKVLRHPQYTGLILAGCGLVMMWGRFIAYVSIIVMIYLYFLLSQKEEQLCRNRFGNAYETYCRASMGIFPGADALARFFWIKGPAAAVLGLLLVLGFALGSGFTVMKARQALCPNPPLFQKNIVLQGRQVALVSPKFHFLDSQKRKGPAGILGKHVSPEMFFCAMESSQKISGVLAQFQKNGMNAALLIFEPRLAIREQRDVTFFSYYIIPMKVKNGPAGMGLMDLERNTTFLGMARIENMAAVSGTESVKGNVRIISTADMKQDQAATTLIRNKVDILLSRFY